MRRKDREITDREDIDRIIRGAQVCRVALAVDSEPYIVPLSFGYDGEAFYFHTARRGRKIDMIAANPRVCFELEGDVETSPDPVDACDWGLAYESVVGYGTVSESTSREEKAHGLDQIMVQYSGREWGFEAANLDDVRVWRLAVESVTGKRCPAPAG